MIKSNQSEVVSRNIFILVLIFFILALALFIFSVVYFGVLGRTTGFAVGYGYVNLTIDTQISLNVTNNTVNWGAGTVGQGVGNATLITHGGGTGTVTNGNWTGGNAQALWIENVGSINASVLLQAGKSAAGFLGGTGPEYQWNVSNKDATACGSWGEATSHDRFADVNVSAAATVCNQLDFHAGSRGLYVDFRLVVPVDVNASIATGLVQADTITITGSTAI